MDKQQYIAQVRKLFDEVYSRGNIAKLDQFMASDVRLVDSAAPSFKGGLATLKQIEQSYETAFPGKSLKIDDIFATDDNRVVVRWTCTGVNKGQLDDISATNRSIKINGISVYSFKGDKITEVYQSWDRLGLLEQLGVIEEQLSALHR